MTSSIKAGLDPGPLQVILSDDADFLYIWRYRVGGVITDWPAGTELTIVFGDGTEWDATIVDEFATWDVDATATTIPRGTSAKIRYVNGTTKQTWRRGAVARRD